MVFDYSEKKEIVRKTNSDILRVRFIENDQRKNSNPLFNSIPFDKAN